MADAVHRGIAYAGCSLDGEVCETSRCCRGSTCVANAKGDGVDRCADQCFRNRECGSNCCMPIGEGPGVCVRAMEGRTCMP